MLQPAQERTTTDLAARISVPQPRALKLTQQCRRAVIDDDLVGVAAMEIDLDEVVTYCLGVVERL